MDGLLIADIFGLILALPISLFLAYWMSAVKNNWAVVIGALVFAVIGFAALYAWASTLTNVSPVPVFFGAVLFCSAMGLIGGIISDLLIARGREHDYRRQAAQEHK